MNEAPDSVQALKHAEGLQACPGGVSTANPSHPALSTVRRHCHCLLGAISVPDPVLSTGCWDCLFWAKEQPRCPALLCNDWGRPSRYLPGLHTMPSQPTQTLAGSCTPYRSSGTFLSPEQVCSLKPCSHEATARAPTCVAPRGAGCDPVVVHVVDLGGVPSREAQLDVHAGRLLLLKPRPVGVGVACRRWGAGALPFSWVLIRCNCAVGNKIWPVPCHARASMQAKLSSALMQPGCGLIIASKAP